MSRSAATRKRPPPLSPSQHERAEATALPEPARTAALERIEVRMATFQHDWPGLIAAGIDAKGKPVFSSCTRCGRGLAAHTGLILEGAAYCAGCRTRIWSDYGRRVGVYP